MIAETVAFAMRAARGRLEAEGNPDAQADATWLMAHILGERTRSGLCLRTGERISQADQERFEALLARRIAGEPLQYVMGNQRFMGRDFVVDARVLIPRPETEMLCERALARIPLGDAAQVLDVGTGSGALAVSIALARPKACVTAVDISTDALAVAGENALRLGARVRFAHSDLFAALLGRRFDVIVSNPPYIARDALAGLQAEVQQEPRLALDGGPDGLDIYRRLAREGASRLRGGGRMLVEVGMGQAQAVAALFAAQIGPVDIARDMQGTQRIVEAVYEGR